MRLSWWEKKTFWSEKCSTLENGFIGTFERVNISFKRYPETKQQKQSLCGDEC